jgi:hypothetical protein
VVVEEEGEEGEEEQEERQKGRIRRPIRRSPDAGFSQNHTINHIKKTISMRT